MKRILAIASALVLLAGCEKYDDTPIKEAISSLEDRIKVLETLNDDVAALKEIVEGKALVVSCMEEDGRYIVTLSDGKVLTVNKGLVGTPVVTLLDLKGKTCWAYYIDGKVEPILIDGKPVEVASAVLPQIRVSDDGLLEVSVDEGKTWVETEAKLQGGLFSAVQKQDGCVLFTLADGVTQYAVPLLDESEIEFIAFAGPQYFNAGETLSVPVEMIGIDGYTITEKPEGWKALLTQGKLEVTAPSEGVGDTSGYIKMLGVGGTTKIAQVYVTVGQAPVDLSVDEDWKITIKPNPTPCFYGVSLMSDFNPGKIASDLTGKSPMQARLPYTSTKVTMPLSDLVAEVLEGETYVVWVLPVTGKTYTETDVLYQAVSSIDVQSNVTNVSFEDASIMVRVKGTDEYYLVPMEEEMTVDHVIEDLNGAYADTYNRFRHYTLFRGTLSELVDSPMAGQEYDFLVLPVRFGAYLKSEAESFTVKLNDYAIGGSASVSVEKGDVAYKSLSAKVSADADTYKVLIDVVSATDYAAKGYADDKTLVTYLSTLQAEEYEDDFTFVKDGLDSGTKYWFVAVAVDKYGAVGSPVRVEASTKSVEYSGSVLSLGEIVLNLNTAQIPVSVEGGIESYRYIVMSSDAGGYWYNTFIDNDQAAYDALVYGTVDYVDLKASSVTSGITISDLEFGSSYIFRIIGYDKDGKVTNMGKKDFSPSVGKVVASTDSKWAASKPTVLAEISGNAIALSVTFPQGCSSYVVTKMSSEEYSAAMPGSARLKTDYVVGHGSALTFNENLDGYDPGWYISSDLPYILVAWTDGIQWYEPLVIDSATGKPVN